MDSLFYSFGILRVVSASLKIIVKSLCALGPSFLSAKYGICDGPGAEMLLVCLIVSCTSDSVISLVAPLYHNWSILFMGSYSLFHSGGIVCTGCVCVQS